MALISATPARRRTPFWVAASGGGLVVALAGMLMLGRWPGVGVWALIGGAVVSHWAGRRASDCGILARLDRMSLAQLAMPPARVAACSATPVADLMRIRSAGCGVIDVHGVPRVLSAERLDRHEVDLLLSGRWDRLAVPAPELDGSTPADHLARLPDEDETWLVGTPIGLLALRGEHLRSVASSMARDLRRVDDSQRRRSDARRPRRPAAAGGGSG